jgi:tetratricopeptide (TPR) repeat protein
MDEQEVPEKSSEDISNNKSLPEEDVIPASSDAESSASESIIKLDENSFNNEADRADKSISTAPEELPTMHWSDVYAELAEFEQDQSAEDRQDRPSPEQHPRSRETGPIDGLEEAMNWLEELAAGQGMPIDEMPTLVTDQPNPDAPTNKSAKSEPLSDPESDAEAIEMDSDPMAWLEQLAVDQSSPLEELPSVADRLLASEIVSQNEIPPSSTINDPYDIDRALTYLEQLAVAQGIDLSAVSFDANQPVNSLDSALAIIDGLALTGMAVNRKASKTEDFDEREEASNAVNEDGGVEELSPVDEWSKVSLDMPDDPQQALDWLGAIDSDQEAAEIDIVLEGDTLATKGEETSQEPAVEDANLLSVDVLDEMPEDPDEAVAWMEDLARHDFKKPMPKNEDLDIDEDQEPSSPLENGPSETTLSAENQGKPADDDLQNTISKYQKIIDEDAVTEGDVEALEAFIDSHGESPKLFRILGDAYMQVGQMDKAIATYRKGFDHF